MAELQGSIGVPWCEQQKITLTLRYDAMLQLLLNLEISLAEIQLLLAWNLQLDAVYIKFFNFFSDQILAAEDKVRALTGIYGGAASMTEDDIQACQIPADFPGNPCRLFPQSNTEMEPDVTPDYAAGNWDYTATDGEWGEIQSYYYADPPPPLSEPDPPYWHVPFTVVNQTTGLPVIYNSGPEAIARQDEIRVDVQDLRDALVQPGNDPYSERNKWVDVRVNRATGVIEKLANLNRSAEIIKNMHAQATQELEDLTREMQQIFVTYPVGGETVNIGNTMNTTWDYRNLSNNAAIWISRDGGLTYNELGTCNMSDSSYNWLITGPTSNTCLIKVSSVDVPTIFGESAEVFVIEG